MSKGYEFRSGFESYWISAELVDALEEYVRIGRPLGSFLQAVVSNDFKDAVGRADGTNIRNLPAFAAYVYNEMPGPSQGSREKYKAWILMHAEKRALEAAENAATGNAPEARMKPRRPGSHASDAVIATIAILVLVGILAGYL